MKVNSNQISTQPRNALKDKVYRKLVYLVDVSDSQSLSKSSEFMQEADQCVQKIIYINVVNLNVTICHFI